MTLLQRLREARDEMRESGDVGTAKDIDAMLALVEAAQRTLDNADNPSFKWPETVKSLRAALAAFTEDKQGRIPS